MRLYLRHGHAEHNEKGLYNSNPSHPKYFPSYLTPTGVAQLCSSCEQLKASHPLPMNFERVFVSPLPRTKQSAEILAHQEFFTPQNYYFDDRLTELKVGEWESQPYRPYEGDAPEGVKDFETYPQLKKRVQEFIDEELKGLSSFCVISHKCVLEALILLYEKKSLVLETGSYYIAQ